jgi:predicted GNAT family N-acyltransferase
MKEAANMNSDILPRPDISDEQWEKLSATIRAARDPRDASRLAFVGTYTGVDTLRDKYNKGEAVLKIDDDSITAYGMIRKAGLWDEIGTVFVGESARGKRYTRMIIQNLLTIVENRDHSAFGITSNDRMASAFIAAGFDEITSPLSTDANPGIIQDWFEKQGLRALMPERKFDAGRRLFVRVRQ